MNYNRVGTRGTLTKRKKLDEKSGFNDTSDKGMILASAKIHLNQKESSDS